MADPKSVFKPPASGWNLGTQSIPWTTVYATKYIGGNMKGATASAAGEAGLVPAPAAGAQSKFLRGDGTFAEIPIDPNAFYRNKHLGTITAATVESFLNTHGVPTGEFRDIFVGDEVDIIGDTYNKTWVVVGIDHFWNVGNTMFTNHHLVLMPRTSLLLVNMNDTDVTWGGFKDSKMFTTILPQINTNLTTVLGSHLLTRRTLLSNSVDSNSSSASVSLWKGASIDWEWVDCKAMLPTEVQICGSTIFSSSAFDVGEGSIQFPVFKFYRYTKILSGDWFWLRGVAGSQHFCRANGDGSFGTDNASHSNNVIPLICIG